MPINPDNTWIIVIGCDQEKVKSTSSEDQTVEKRFAVEPNPSYKNFAVFVFTIQYQPILGLPLELEVIGELRRKKKMAGESSLLKFLSPRRFQSTDIKAAAGWGVAAATTALWVVQVFFFPKFIDPYHQFQFSGIYIRGYFDSLGQIRGCIDLFEIYALLAMLHVNDSVFSLGLFFHNCSYSLRDWDQVSFFAIRS